MKRSKIYAMMCGVVACTMLTACPDPDPDPTPTPDPTDDSTSGGTAVSEWVMTAQSRYENGTKYSDEQYTYDANGRLTSIYDRIENAHYDFDYTSNKIVMSGTERCSYSLTNGLVTSGSMGNALFTYDSSNRLVYVEDDNYATTLKWSGSKLVSMEVIDLEDDDYAIAIKFKYSSATGIHSDCCRAFNVAFMAMIPSVYMATELFTAGYFGVVPSDEVITGYEPLTHFGDPDEETLNVSYTDIYGNGRPAEAVFSWAGGSENRYYTWGQL